MIEYLDNTDKKILKELQKNARINTKEMAHKVGLTITPTYERLKKIEQTGIIKDYVTLLDRTKIDKNLAAFCTVTLQIHSQPLLKQFESMITKIDEVMECYHVAGTFDYMLKIVIKDMNQYQDFLINKLAAFENIAHVNSVFVMTEIKHETAYVL